MAETTVHARKHAGEGGGGGGVPLASEDSLETCSADGCDRASKAAGLCGMHYQRRRKERGVVQTKKCSIDGCESPFVAKGMCRPHYMKQYMGGHGSAYDSAHQAVRKEFGPASSHDCVLCGSQAKDWGYMGDGENDPCANQAPRGQWYSTDVTQYRPLCRPCHGQLDRTGRRKAYKDEVRPHYAVWREAAGALGLTTEEYGRTFGRSTKRARLILALLELGVSAEAIILAGNVLKNAK